VGRIVSLANQKGGVGKTTTTISLGAALAEHGKRVLLVDFDPQGALSVGMGINPMALDTTVYNLLLDRTIAPGDVVLKTETPNVSLLPSNIDLSAAEVVLVQEVAREQSLKRALGHVRDDFDFVLIDCPPSLGLLTVNALTASDGVVIPLECEYFALRGMALLIDTIEKVRDRLNPELEVQGIVATMYDGRTLHGREVLERVRQAFGNKLFRTIVQKTIRFAEAPVAGQPILTYAPGSKGAAAYRALAKEVLGIDDETSEPSGSGGAVPQYIDLRDESPGEALPGGDGGTPPAGTEAQRPEDGERPAATRGESDVLLHP
jgi:chromosome partitioning protein